MRHPLLLFFFFLPSFCIAQQSYFGVKGGLSWSNYSSSDVHHDFRTSFNAGVTYQYKIDSRFSIGADLLYTQRGFRDDIALRDETNQSLGTATFKTNLNYIALPLKFGYTVGKTFYGFANLGIVPAFLVHGAELTDGTTALGPIDASLKPRRFDLGGLAEVGGGYAFARYSIYISLTAQRNVTSASSDEFYQNGKLQYYGYSLSAGVNYKLRTQ